MLTRVLDVLGSHMLFIFVNIWEKHACILSYRFGMAKSLITIKKSHGAPLTTQSKGDNTFYQFQKNQKQGQKLPPITKNYDADACYQLF